MFTVPPSWPETPTMQCVHSYLTSSSTAARSSPRILWGFGQLVHNCYYEQHTFASFLSGVHGRWPHFLFWKFLSVPSHEYLPIMRPLSISTKQTLRQPSSVSVLAGHGNVTLPSFPAGLSILIHTHQQSSPNHLCRRVEIKHLLALWKPLRAHRI